MGLLKWLKAKIGKGSSAEASVIIKGSSAEASILKRQAKAAIQAESRAELAQRAATRKRLEFTESLRAYKAKREAERRIRKIPAYTYKTKVPQEQPMYQFGAIFDMKDEKTGEIKKDVEGWSLTHTTKDYETGYDEAVKSAQLKAGGSNWYVIGVKKEKWRVYK